MAENEVRLTNGRRWTAQQFVDHYFKPTASGTPTPVTGPPSPVDVDRAWYMSEGPGKYYHPGMFPIINTLIERRDLAPGTYDLLDFVPNRDKRDPSLTAKLSNYTTDMRSADYLQRALVFGSESARITGKVEVNPDGSKTFKQIEIRPWETQISISSMALGGRIRGLRLDGRSQEEPTIRKIRASLTTFNIVDQGRSLEPDVFTILFPIHN